MKIELSTNELRGVLRTIDSFFTQELVDESIGVHLILEAKKGATSCVVKSSAKGMSFESQVPGSCLKKGTIMLKHDYLNALRFSGKTISLEDDGPRVSFRSQRLEGVLDSLHDVPENRIKQSISDENLVELSQDLLASGLAATSFSPTATEDYSDIRIRSNGNFVYFVSADSYRGVVWKFPEKVSEFSMDLPHEFVQTLRRNLGSASVKLGASKNQLIVVTDSYRLIHPSIQVRKIPNVEARLKSLMARPTPCTKCEVDTAEFLEVISEVTSIASGKSNVNLGIELSFGKSAMNVSVEASIGRTKSAVDVNYLSKRRVKKVGVGAFYLSEFLQASKTKESPKAFLTVRDDLILVKAGYFQGIVPTMISGMD